MRPNPRPAPAPRDAVEEALSRPAGRRELGLEVFGAEVRLSRGLGRLAAQAVAGVAKTQPDFDCAKTLFDSSLYHS